MLNGITKNDGTIKLSYLRVFDALMGDAKTPSVKDRKYYLKVWTRSRGHQNLLDGEYTKMLDVLKSLSIPYELGNDGKRGGLEHDFILVKFDGRNKGVKFLRSLDIKSANKFNANNYKEP